MHAARLLALCALAGATLAGALPVGPSASSSREGHTAAAAFDPTSATYWQSSTPAAGAWLVYVFPMNVTVLQYSLTVPDDSRYAATDGPVAFELQASTGQGAASWTPIDRRFDEALWRPAETRVYTAKYPATGGAGDATPYRAFRLLIAKVPGRSADLSFVSVADMRFLTRESLPPLCDQLDGVAVNISAVGMPPGVNDTATGMSSTATAQNAQLYIFVNVTNTGVNPVSLRDVHLPLRFSRGVQSWDGTWAAPAPETFNLSCWGLYISNPDAKPNAKQLDLCGTTGVRLAMAPWGLDVDFKADTLLCPGCTLTGPPPVPGSAPMPSFEVQHGSFGRLDVETLTVAPIQCGNAPDGSVLTPLAVLPVPGVERHPACAPWAGGGGSNATPACAADLSQLVVTLAYTYVDGPNDPLTGQPQRGRELRLRPTLRNYGPTTVPLFGVSFTVIFPRAVALPTTSPGPDGSPLKTMTNSEASIGDFTADCFWAQVTTKDGVPVYGQRPVCEYLSATPSDTGNGMEVTFLGGALCAGCALSGSSGNTDAMLNIKHTQYAQLATQPPVVLDSPKGAVHCDAPDAPPARCTSPAPAPL
jgi:hypothetical protein